MDSVSALGTSPVEEITISATVIRCGCGDPLNIHEQFPDGSIGVCPTPRTTEERGVISYWHRNPLKRVAHRIKGKL